MSPQQDSPEHTPAGKVVMIFGVFDGLHEGHVSFLNQARALGDHLTVVVAQDESVMRLKNHPPTFSLEDRMDALQKSDLADHVIPGDETEGGWEVILKYQPHTIALGYDQTAMHEHLETCVSSFPFVCDIIILEPYKPEEMHSSLLRVQRK